MDQLPLLLDAPPPEAPMPRPKSPTLTAYAEDWLAAYGKPPYYSEHAASVRAYNLRHYVLPTLGERPLDAITPNDLQRLQEDLLERVSLRMAQHVLRGSLARVLKTAQRDGYLSRSPLTGMIWPPSEEPPPDPFDERESARILDYFRAERPEWLPLVACVFLAGMRPSEACGLFVDSVDFRTGKCGIRGALVSGERTRGKTRKSQRTIDLDPELLQILRDAVPRWARPDDLLLQTRKGEPINSRTWGSYHFTRALKALGIRHRGFYHGRHTFISISATHGAPLPHIAAYCGTSVAYIEKHYLRWLGSMASPLPKRPAAREEHVDAVQETRSRGYQL